MSRIRTIKPALFKNEHLAELPTNARYLFIGLFCLADKEGRLEDRPKRIKVEVFPYDDVNVDELLSQLNAADFINRYEVGGMKIIQVTNFTKHQRITGSESATESIYPGNTKETRRKHLGRQEGKGREGNKEGKGYRERKRGIFPPPDFEIELDETKINQAVEYLSHTKHIEATPEMVLSLWAVFKTKNFTGEKFYKDEADIKTHFFNSLKYENLNNGSHQQSTGKTGEKLGTSAARIDVARKW